MVIFTKLSTIWLWYHIHVWKRLMCVPGKKHSQKFRHIGYNIDPYGQSFFPNCISAWNGLAKDIAEANTLDIFKSKLQN